MKEIWKPIDGYEGLYEVSNFGRVRSLDRVIRHAFNTGLNKTKSVKAIDVSTGNEFKVFSSVAEAQEYFGNRGTSNISNALHGRSKTAYGYRWEFVDA